MLTTIVALFLALLVNVDMNSRDLKTQKKYDSSGKAKTIPLLQLIDLY
jgi:hypothetical protein